MRRTAPRGFSFAEELALHGGADDAHAGVAVDLPRAGSGRRASDLRISIMSSVVPKTVTSRLRSP